MEHNLLFWVQYKLSRYLQIKPGKKAQCKEILVINRTVDINELREELKKPCPVMFHQFDTIYEKTYNTFIHNINE